MLVFKNTTPTFILEGDSGYSFVYQGETEILRKSQLNNTGFLKYYNINMIYSFLLGVKGNPLAPFDQTYKPSLTTGFLGPDIGINPYKPTYDEYLNYRSNIATSFVAGIILGNYDQPLTYDFIDTTVSGNPLAISDQAYKPSLTTGFVGPDIGINLYKPTYDEYLNYRSNIATSFISTIIYGNYDQDFNPSFLDIIVSGNPLAISDQAYKPSLTTSFVGPDIGLNPYKPTYDEYLNYRSNIATSFISTIIYGNYDQDFDPSFLDTIVSGNPLAISDQAYKLDLVAQFVGPDIGLNIIVPEYLQYLKYSTNINTSFVQINESGFIDTGVFDQNLVFSQSNFTTYFK